MDYQDGLAIGTPVRALGELGGSNPVRKDTRGVVIKVEGMYGKARRTQVEWSNGVTRWMRGSDPFVADTSPPVSK